MPNLTDLLPARPARLALLGLIAAISVGGCAQLKGRQGYVVDPVLTDAIAPGIDNRESVERTLGRPTFVG
jgi:outer membrane protein assembly factor BamE (lipoprotein component of BamABCDE complex)